MTEQGSNRNGGGKLLRLPLRGIVPPLITPLTQDRKLDAGALHRLVDHLLSGGVHGLFVLGSTGEAPSLDGNTRRAVIAETCAAAKGRVPVLVNVSDTCWEESRDLARHAEATGAAGLAICPPYYFPLEQAQLRSYVERFAASVGLPLFVYNIPQFARNEFAAETVARLAEVANVVGVKNSNGSVDYLSEVRRQTTERTEFSLLVGSEEILWEGIEAGAHGGVCGGANMFPRLYVRLYEASAQREREEAERLQSLVRRVAGACYRIGPKGTAYLRGLKYAMSLLGLAGDTLAEPLQTFDEAERGELRKRFEEVMPFVRRIESN